MLCFCIYHTDFDYLPLQAVATFQKVSNMGFVQQPIAVVGDRATAVFHLVDDSTTEGIEEFTVRLVADFLSRARITPDRSTAVVQILDNEGKANSVACCIHFR